MSSGAAGQALHWNARGTDKSLSGDSAEHIGKCWAAGDRGTDAVSGTSAASRQERGTISAGDIH